MPRWRTEPLWQGLDVFVIGGGPSLMDFRWSRISGRATIGCNSAYKLGADVCRICFFGDRSFWLEHKRYLSEYKGLVLTNNKTLEREPEKWLYSFERGGEGVRRDYPAWNGNSGACATNLALILGAKRVALLGMDMKQKDGTANWYRPGISKSSPYSRFMRSFELIAKDYAKLFPGQEIVNVNDDSDLKCFPTMTVKEFFKQEEWK